MSEPLGTQESPNKWASPEARALLAKHSVEQLHAGIFISYLLAAENQYVGKYSSIVRSRELIQAELPLGMHIEKPAYDDIPDSRRIFLLRFNPVNGQELYEPHTTGADTMVCAATVDDVTGEVYESDPNFSEDQISLLLLQSKELVEADLILG